MIWTIWGPFIVPVNREAPKNGEKIYICSLFKDIIATQRQEVISPLVIPAVNIFEPRYQPRYRSRSQ